MCSKVTLGDRFDSNFSMVRNFWMRPKCFRKYIFGAYVETEILYFFDGNQESYSRLNMAYHVTLNTDSNYLPMEGHKNGSLRIRSWIWLGNIFPIARDQSSWNRILGRKYVSGKLFTSRNRLGNVFKSDLWSPFWQ